METIVRWVIAVPLAAAGATIGGYVVAWVFAIEWGLDDAWGPLLLAFRAIGVGAVGWSCGELFVHIGTWVARARCTGGAIAFGGIGMMIAIGLLLMAYQTQNIWAVGQAIAVMVGIVAGVTHVIKEAGQLRPVTAV